MNLKNLKLNYLAVKSLREEKTAGGIIRPDFIEDSVLRGKVYFAGPGAFQNGTFVENRVSVGDYVLFSMHGKVAEIAHVDKNGEEIKLSIIRELDVYAQLEDQEEAPKV